MHYCELLVTNFVSSYTFFATAWTVRGSNPVRRQGIFPFLKTVQTLSRAHPAPHSLGAWSFPRCTWLGHKLTTQFQLLPRLGMSGAQVIAPRWWFLRESKHVGVAFINFDVLLTVHLSIFVLIINQIDAQNLFYNKFISCLYMFRALCAYRQEVKIVLYSLWYHHTYRWPSRAQVERGQDGHL